MTLFKPLPPVSFNTFEAQVVSDPVNNKGLGFRAIYNPMANEMDNQQ